MKNELGRWIPAGMAEGIRENTKTVGQAMNDVVKETTGTLQADLEMGVKLGQRQLNRSQQQSQGTADGGYHQYITIQSPEHLSPSEVARLTRIATRDMVLSLKKGV